MNINSNYILGISCFYHDSAAALIKDGILLAAIEEERFSRKKHDENFPEKSIEYCLNEGRINIHDISAIVFYDKPLLKFERILVSFIKSWPFEYSEFLSSISSWLSNKLWIKSIIREKLRYDGKIYFSEHHLSHAAGSFFISPFKSSAILSVDGVGEWATAVLGKGNENKIEILKEIKYPNSLGLFYSAITYFLGFKPNGDEYKVMGLAPYGKPVYAKTLNKIIALFDDGSFKINTKYFNNYSLKKIEKEFENLWGFPRRNPESSIEAHHKDLAASLQVITNEIMIRLAKYARIVTGEDNLCLSGGVALNCVSNSVILNHSGFKNVFIQPASGDDGGAVGAAYYFWNHIQSQPRTFVMKHAFWGPKFEDGEIKELIKDKKLKAEYLDTGELVKKTAKLIDEQKVVGWFQGRSEWGPRALGNRSILADPRNKSNWQRINVKIKFRESFRPFAPAILGDKVQEYFDQQYKSPFMLFNAQVTNEKIPAVTHIDNSARLQTVNYEENPLFHKLLKEFDELTGCPVLINTSFNTREEPIVLTPEDALKTFLITGLDVLVMGNFIIYK